VFVKPNQFSDRLVLLAYLSKLLLLIVVAAIFPVLFLTFGLNPWSVKL